MNVLNVLQAAERSIAKATDASHIVSASRRMWIERLKPHAADPQNEQKWKFVKNVKKSKW